MSDTSVDMIQDVETQMSVLFANGRRLTQRAARMVHPELQTSGLYVMRMLQKHGPLRPSAIAENLEIDRSAVSRIISPLDGLGLVERVTDPGDRRAFIISLTEEGRARLANLSAEPNGPLRSMLAGWNPDDVAALARLLTRLNEETVTRGLTR